MTRTTAMTVDFELEVETRTKPTVRKNVAMPEGEKKRIGEMLSYRRPHDSPGEAEFVERYILPLSPTLVVEPASKRDKAPETVHAYIVRIEGSALQNQRAFCAHVDSVHNRQQLHTRQSVGYDSFLDQFFVPDDKQRDCLGADDAAGVYVLLRMIEAKVPGMYVFFRGEERGGIGSSYVQEVRPDVFEGITQAIQFDRRGTKSIITEMMCGMTCSDTFALALGEALEMGHEPDDSGSFTDTANLASIVAECTNISVGYDWEHSSHEVLEAGYLVDLADRCVEVFADPDLDLPVKREPGQFRKVRQLNYEVSRIDDGIYSYEFGQVTVYDLPNMTADDLDSLVRDSYVSDLVTLLSHAAEVVVDAYPTFYKSTRN